MSEGGGWRFREFVAVIPSVGTPAVAVALCGPVRWSSPSGRRWRRSLALLGGYRNWDFCSAGKIPLSSIFAAYVMMAYTVRIIWWRPTLGCLCEHLSQDFDLVVLLEYTVSSYRVITLSPAVVGYTWE